MSANKIVVTNVAAFIAAVDPTSATSDYTCIEIESASGDEFVLSSTLNIPPDFTGTSSKRLIIEGNGITIKCAAGGFGNDTALISRKSVSDVKSCSLIFRNINFDCQGNQMTALELYNATDVVIENCRFNNCKTGLILKCIDTAAINNCTATNITAFGFYVGVSELVTNPNPTLRIPAARCNNIIFNNCKVLGSNASSAIGYSLIDAVACELSNCQAKNLLLTGIEFIESIITPNGIKINNFTIFANTPGTTGVKLVMGTGYAVIDGYFAYALGVAGIVVDGSALSNSGVNFPLPHIYVNRLPFLQPSYKFSTVGGIAANSPCNIPQPTGVAVWEFNEVFDGDNIFSAARWNGGFIPYYRYAEFFSESKTILTNAMTINSKPI